METDTSSAQNPVCPNRWSTNMTSWNMGFARSQETHVDSVGSRLQEISHKTQRGKRGNNWHITIHSLLFVYYLNPSRIVCILCALISWFQYMSQLHKRLTATCLFAFTLECTKQKRLECDNQDRKQFFLRSVVLPLLLAFALAFARQSLLFHLNPSLGALGN